MGTYRSAQTAPLSDRAFSAVYDCSSFMRILYLSIKMNKHQLVESD